MGTEIKNQHDLKIVKSNNTDRSIVSVRRSAFIGIIAFLILAFLFGAIIYQRYSSRKQDNKEEALTVANNARVRLQESLAFSLSATRTLSFFVQNDGSVKNFDSIASQILNATNDIDALQLVPAGVIRYVYPLKGNEKVIGYDILKDSSRNKEAYKAIEKREMFFAGPFELKQGGIGVVGRLPVFRNNKFWGFSAVVIKMPTLLRNAGMDSTGNTGYYFQLSKINPDTKKEEFFIKRQVQFLGSENVSVIVPNGEWKLSVIPVKTYSGFEDIILLTLLGLLFAVLGGLYVYNVSRRPMKLDQLVKERTRQFIESEEKFSKTFQSKVMGFAIFDNDFKFIDINETYAAILETDRSEILGKTSDEAGLISKIIPEKRTAISDLIESILKTEGHLHNFEIEIKTQKGELVTVFLSVEHLDLNNKTHWLTSVIDITINKKAELLVQESEVKYRSLIEQASDGIIITDLKGVILEVNRSIATLGGYDIDFMIGKHAENFIPQEDIEANPFRFDELLKGGSLLHERRFLKKDGTFIFVEVNSKMTSLHTLIGFVRDISARKLAEEALKLSEERYRALVENAPEALVVMDVKKQKFVSVSDSATRLFKMSKEELLKVGPSALSPEYQPDGRLSSEVIVINMQKAIAGEKPSFEWTHCDKDQNPIPCEVWLVRIPSENDILIRGSIIDITERKKAEQEIIRSKKQFQNLVENISGVYWVNNLDTNETLYISPSFESIWGLKCEDLYENPAHFINAVHPEDKTILIEAYKNISKTLNANTTYRIIRPDGEIRWISANTNVLTDKEGNIIEYGYAEDITKRKLAAEVLQESENFLKETQIIANLGTYTLDITTGKWTSSEILDKIFGIDAGFNKTFENWSTILHTDWREVMNNYFLEEVIGKKCKFDKEYKIIRINDKAERWVHGIGSLKYNDKNEPIEMVGTIHDITERKLAAEEIKANSELLRELYSYLQNIREEERTHIAREIHDELGQQLTGLKMDLSWLSRKLKSEDQMVNEKISGTINLIDTAIKTVRKIATELRPSILDDLGLVAALEWQGEEFEKRSDIKVNFTHNIDQTVLMPVVITAMFRIYQELLTNVARHANASKVNTSIYIKDNKVYLSVQDNGIGFFTDEIINKKTLGLQGIKERTNLIGGVYEIKSSPGEGTFVLISVPLLNNIVNP